MITIKNTDFTSNIDLAAILMVQTKEEMIETGRKLDLYVSPNLKKDKTARRLADEILDNPLAVLYSLSKTELQLVNDFVKTGPNKYVTMEMKKICYKLQKYALVLTYETYEACASE